MEPSQTETVVGENAIWVSTLGNSIIIESGSAKGPERFRFEFRLGDKLDEAIAFFVSAGEVARQGLVSDDIEEHLKVLTNRITSILVDTKETRDPVRGGVIMVLTASMLGLCRTISCGESNISVLPITYPVKIDNIVEWIKKADEFGRYRSLKRQAVMRLINDLSRPGYRLMIKGEIRGRAQPLRRRGRPPLVVVTPSPAGLAYLFVAMREIEKLIVHVADAAGVHMKSDLIASEAISRLMRSLYCIEPSLKKGGATAIRLYVTSSDCNKLLLRQLRKSD